MSYYLTQAQNYAEAFFIYAACTEDGYVKVGITRTPFKRIAAIHYGSPSPVMACQWAWIGGAQMGRDIESGIFHRWKERRTRGEWYHFNYSDPAQKREFHDGLNDTVVKVCGSAAEWERLGPEKVKELVRDNILEGRRLAAERRKKVRFY